MVVGSQKIETLEVGESSGPENICEHEQNHEGDRLEYFEAIIDMVRLALIVIVLDVLPYRQVRIHKEIVVEIGHG